MTADDAGTRFPEFHERLISAVLPSGAREGLALAGCYALRAHGLTDRPCADLRFAVAADEPLPEVARAMSAAWEEAGFEVSPGEAGPRAIRLLVTEPVVTPPLPGRTCEITLLGESPLRPAARRDDLPVVSVEDAASAAVRALHDRGLAIDLIDVAALSTVFSFRELEGLARARDDAFSLHELVMRLEFAALIADPDFTAHGITEDQTHEIRRFAYTWAEDIKLRRTEDGDLDEPNFDLPTIDD
ncbi:hypothetical protein [Spongiactinospora sp. TRM90649]|uniref:hypothetical protein n=1 Tax=Spongiactinospora sp. TRM90649 TaxID=3031114 RepID=UPI0023F61D1C|nr:hypothetical protein [Spongiactinospora sp. TRM90649]MDF5752658.1 hypothetical protein [Spongiactinospora sp. TRM90649]